MPTATRPDEAVRQEAFSRTLGRRTSAAFGAPPSRASRDALTQMANYRTGAPKGIFRYATHEEANRDRDRWTVAKAVALLQSSAVCADPQSVKGNDAK